VAVVPAAPLTPERIVDEAIALLDAEGPEALSMRRLAARLGTSTMSTYHHVPDKRTLVEAVAERIMAELERPSDDVPWDEAVRRMAWSFRGLTQAHPAVFRVLLSGERPSALVRTADDVVHRLEAAGFDPDTAVLTFRTFIRYLIGSTVLEADSPLHRQSQDDTFRYGLEVVIAGIAAGSPVTRV
jgi:AcrR family transcriptional regulator